jgi:hypothetical protein
MPPSSPRLPDFLLVGAMKCGTTSLHHVLDHHPGLFLPRAELFFFDIDDVQQHPDFFVRTPRGWTFFDYEAEFERYLPWYAAHFAGAAPGQLVGEDSTTYLPSPRAPERIRALLPEAKILVLLRDPVDRAVSHYWHLVESRRAVHTLEETLAYAPENLLVRGHYREQLERYLRVFPREQVKVLFFERFVRDVQGTVDEVCAFLGLDESVDTASVPTWSNRTAYPRSLRLQLAYNRLVRPVTHRRWLLRADLPPTNGAALAGAAPAEAAAEAAAAPGLKTRAVRALATLDRRLNARPGRRPPLDPHTREFLARYFARQNAGLSDLLGEDVAALWPNLRGYAL